MSKKDNSQIPGQMTIEMCINRQNYVVQANDLIGGRQALGLNSAKLIRTAVMQIKPDDTDIKPYLITIKQLSDLLDVPVSNLYRDANTITDDILQNPIFIFSREGRGTRWVKIPWVEYCQYDSDVGITIQLNQRLKPFLIALRDHYTQYPLENILAMKSVYAIRIFEMLQAKIMFHIIPREGTHIKLTLEEIIEGCELSETYRKISNLKNRVIDVAMNEIKRVTFYDVSYSSIKNGRRIEAFDFYMNMKYHSNANKNVTDIKDARMDNA